MWQPGRTVERPAPPARGPLTVDHLTEGQWRRPLFHSSRGRLTAGQIWTLFGFLMMFVHPVSRNWLIFPIYIISAAVGLFRHFRRRVRSPAPISILFVIVVGCLLTFLSIIRGTPGGQYVALPIVFGPCIYYAIALGLDRRTVNRLPGLMAASTAVVSVTIIIVAVFGTQSWMFWLNPQAGSIEANGGFTVRMGAIGSLAGLTPFMAFYLASWHGRRGRRYTVYATILAGAIAAAFFSGRTAIMLVSLLSIVVAAIARVLWWSESGDTREITKRHDRAIFPGAYLIVAVTILGTMAAAMLTPLSVSDTAERTLAKFGIVDETTESTSFITTGQASAQIRQRQAGLLLDGFFDAPLFGSRTGTVAQDLVRDERRPWAYELQYHLLLFRNGLFGAGLYLAAIGIGIYEMRKRWHGLDRSTRHLTLGAIGAALGILGANATNPYLQAVGQQWALFLPVMVVCARSSSWGGPEDDAGAIEDGDGRAANGLIPNAPVGTLKPAR